MVPARGTKILHAAQRDQKKKKRKCYVLTDPLARSLAILSVVAVICWANLQRTSCPCFPERSHFLIRGNGVESECKGMKLLANSQPRKGPTLAGPGQSTGSLCLWGNWPGIQGLAQLGPCPPLQPPPHPLPAPQVLPDFQDHPSLCTGSSFSLERPCCCLLCFTQNTPAHTTRPSSEAPPPSRLP